MIVADWVCIWWVVVRVAALDGRWREERKEHAARAAIFGNPIFISWLDQAWPCVYFGVWTASGSLLARK